MIILVKNQDFWINDPKVAAKIARLEKGEPILSDIIFVCFAFATIASFVTSIYPAGWAYMLMVPAVLGLALVAYEHFYEYFIDTLQWRNAQKVAKVKERITNRVPQIPAEVLARTSRNIEHFTSRTVPSLLGCLSRMKFRW